MDRTFPLNCAPHSQGLTEPPTDPGFCSLAQTPGVFWKRDVWRQQFPLPSQLCCRLIPSLLGISVSHPGDLRLYLVSGAPPHQPGVLPFVGSSSVLGLRTLLLHDGLCIPCSVQFSQQSWEAASFPSSSKEDLGLERLSSPSW